jgi:hypothetical protein
VRVGLRKNVRLDNHFHPTQHTPYALHRAVHRSVDTPRLGARNPLR